MNQPVGGNNAALNDSSANGQRITTFNVATGIGNSATINYPEVGIIEIFSAVNDTDYLGIGNAETNKIVGRSGYVGRFTPHHFDTVVSDGCTNIAPLTSFTYSGQTITVQTKAMNNLATPVITKNYINPFAKTVTLSSPTSIAGSFNGTGTILATDFINGTFIKTDVAYTFTSKESGLDATFKIRATDTEGITSNNVTANEGITDLRSGRARLENVYDPELTSLTMPLKIEYYSDNATPVDLTDDGFVLNTDDSCTTYDATTGTLANYTGNLAAGETTVTGAGTIAAGIGNITFSAPGAGNDGSVNLLANNISSWLTYPWGVDCDGDTVNDTGACGTASFGLYRGDDRIIYWREVF